uniref:Phospholipid/glycerol acyltransferase domain-containing protein n=1 Tax=viral metagenome TaxID=1070528 RepID=A0A6C0IJS4_9ZZZZ
MLLFILYLLFFEFSALFTFIKCFIQLFFKSVNIPYVWGKLCIQFAGCKLFLIEKSHSLYLDNCIYLSNHRDIYDFPIDAYITGGSGMFISRYINVFVCPIQFIYTCIMKNTVYFKRGAIKDKCEFNKKICNALQKSYYKNMIIYPEGTRRLANTVVPIKKGAMHIAWTYNMAIQIILTRNKEHIINLKQFTAEYGVNLYCYRSEVIQPKYFCTFEEFNNYVSVIWEDSWGKVYGKVYEKELKIKPLIVEPCELKYSNWFYFFHNIVPLLLFTWFCLL